MKKIPLLLISLVVQTSLFQTAEPLTAADVSLPLPAAAQQGGYGAGLSAEEVKASLQRATEYLSGREGTGSLRFSEYVVINGAAIAALYPELSGWYEGYKRWAGRDHPAPERAQDKLLRLMVLNAIGETAKAQELFTEVVALNQEIEIIDSHYAGWYLYGSVVSGDKELAERVAFYLSGRPPTNLDYMIAYSFWKAYEKTGDDQYKDEFLLYAQRLLSYRANYLRMSTSDGHAGVLLSVLARAYEVGKEESYRDLAGEIAAKLLETQDNDGSWNNNIAHTITPAEGLAIYLKTCF